MKIYKEVYDANDFEFWSGARDTVKEMTDEQVKEVFNMLEDVYSDGMSNTELNDFFWFEEDTIAEWLGFDSFEKLCAYNRGEDEEEEDDDDEDEEE